MLKDDLAASSAEKELFNSQNKLRTNPKSMVADLMVLEKAATGSKQADYRESINFLNKMAPVGALKWSDSLAKSAADHCKDIGEKGISGQ